MRSTIFRQYDTRWGSLGYPTKAYSFACQKEIVATVN